MKKLLSGMLVAFVMLTPMASSVQAAEKSNVDKVVIMKPGEKFVPPQSRTNQKKVQAWEIDLDGHKKVVQPFEAVPNGVMGFTDSSGFQYIWDHYEQQYSSKDPYKFLTGTYTIANRSKNPSSMTYKQTATKQTNWTFTGKVSYETGFTIALLAKAKATFGLDVSTSHITTEGTEFGGSFTISPWSTGTLSCYDSGVYSGGAGVWKKYSPSGTSYMGIYYETGDAWVVATNSKALVYEEVAIPHE